MHYELCISSTINQKNNTVKKCSRFRIESGSVFCGHMSQVSLPFSLIQKNVT